MGFPDINAASNWVDVLKSIATPAIALIVAIITYQQWRTNQEKLRLDLYNRRFDIYYRCLVLQQELLQWRNKPEQMELIDPFIRASKESRFLFPESSSVYAIIEKLSHELTCVQIAVNRDDGKQTQTIVQASERGRVLILELEDKLEPFLDFHYAGAKRQQPRVRIKTPPRYDYTVTHEPKP